MPKVPEMLDSLWDRMLTELERRAGTSGMEEKAARKAREREGS